MLICVKRSTINLPCNRKTTDQKSILISKGAFQIMVDAIVSVKYCTPLLPAMNDQQQVEVFAFSSWASLTSLHWRRWLWAGPKVRWYSSRSWTETTHYHIKFITPRPRLFRTAHTALLQVKASAYPARIMVQAVSETVSTEWGELWFAICKMHSLAILLWTVERLVKTSGSQFKIIKLIRIGLMGVLGEWTKSVVGSAI